MKGTLVVSAVDDFERIGVFEMNILFEDGIVSLLQVLGLFTILAFIPMELIVTTN